MCGIAGMAHAERERPASPETVAAMTRLLSHRGPDDEGVWTRANVGLGHRRLSIIDLSGGHQPISNEDDTIHIVFNGEIYNYLPLRSELEARGHRFKTRSDTETILHAYEEFGEACVERLNGMFAFAIWEEKRQRLFLARDRLGKKPLYYSFDGRTLAFSSEIKSLLVLPGSDRSLDFSALDDYFGFGYVPEPRSIFRSIRKVPPAHSLTFADGRVQERRYWKVRRDEGPDESKREEEWAEEIHALLEDAVRIRLMSEVPLGVFLSGGVDSTAITGLMSRLSPGKVKTFSISGGEGVFDELPYARVVAGHFGTEHHELRIRPERVEDLLPRLVGYFDEPFGDSSMLPTYYVSKLARENVTVALSGEGGDELFAGYTWHRKYRAARMLGRWLPAPLRRGAARLLPDSTLPTLHTNPVSRSLYRAGIAARLSLGGPGAAYQELVTAFAPHFKGLAYSSSLKSAIGGADAGPGVAVAAFEASGTDDLLEKVLQTDLEVYLPGDLLTKVDRMSMANSLEVRSPILDYRMVELAARVPSRLKLHQKGSKYILRRAMDGVLPQAIKDRRTKRGFSVPVSQWFRGGLAEYAQQVLLDRSFLDKGYFDPAGIRTVLGAHAKGQRDYGPQIWALLVFAIWSDTYLSGKGE